jgi:hypothetical protein
MVEIKVADLAGVLRSVDRVSGALNTGLEKATHELLGRVDGAVTDNLGTVKYSTGQLVRSNQQSVDTTGGEITGRYWNDNEVGVYREFGTGPNGEANHQGISPFAHPVYSQQGWLIPASEVDVDLEALYGMKKITIKGSDFYATRGQRARPWLYPAYLKAEEHAEQIIEDNINRELRKLASGGD